MSDLARRAGLAYATTVARLVPQRWLVASARLTVPPLLELAPGLRRALMANAGRLLGPLSTTRERRRLAGRVIASFGRFVLELAAPSSRVDDGLLDRARGREHYDAARAIAEARGTGIVGVSLHLGNYEAGPTVLGARIQPLVLLYRPDPAGIFEALRGQRRAAGGVREIALDGPHALAPALDALRRGGVVLAAGDLGAPGLPGRRMPFLGGVARFAPWAPRLSAATGAPMLPCYVVREGRGRRERLQVEMHAPVIPAQGEEADALLGRLLPSFAEILKRYPEQWMIVHRYWEDA